MGNKNGLGKPCTPEKARKISEAQKGKIVSEETRLKQSIRAKEREHQPCPQELREKLQNSYPKMKRIYCQETDQVYKSVHECARQLNVDATNVCAVCGGKHKTTHGYHFSYYNDTMQ